MQQLYVMWQTEKKVVHIEIEQTITPHTSNTFYNGKRTHSRESSNPLKAATTRNTFYTLKTLNDQNTCLSNSIKNAQHVETNKPKQLKKRRMSAQTGYVRFTKPAPCSAIFTQPIYKMEKRQSERQSRRSTQFSHFYNQISDFNKKLISKQYQLDQKVPYTPTKMKVTHSRNFSSIHTQSSKFQALKTQNGDSRLKPKPWEMRKNGFYLLAVNKKGKAVHQKGCQRYHIDAWEIFDREDPQY